jgi:hypothetical protein
MERKLPSPVEKKRSLWNYSVCISFTNSSQNAANSQNKQRILNTFFQLFFKCHLAWTFKNIYMKVKTIDKTNLKASFFKVCLLAMAIFSSFSWARACPLPAPTSLTTPNSSANFTCTSFEANWTPVIGATSYLLDVSNNSNFTLNTLIGYTNIPVAAPPPSSIPPVKSIVTGLPSGITYFFRVRAISTSCGASPYSSVASTYLPGAPIVIFAPGSITCNSATAVWAINQLANTYTIRVTDLNASTVIYRNASYSSTTITLTGLTPNTPYLFSITPNTIPSSCAINSTFNFTTAALPAAPIANSATNRSCNGFRANWNIVSGATGYNVEVATSPSFGPGTTSTNITNGSTNFLDITGLVVGQTYYYRVRSTNECISAYSNTVTVAAVNVTDAPNVYVQPALLKCNSAFVTWAAINTVSSCQITVTDVLSNTVVYNNSNYAFGLLTINLTNLTPNRNYSFSITTNTPCPATTTVNFTTDNILAPIATVASNLSCNGFRANWNIVSGATGYYIDVATDPSFATNTLVSGYNNRNVANGSSNFLDIAGLAVNTTYYYRVTASKTECISNYSSTISATTVNSCSSLTAMIFTPSDFISCNKIGVQIMPSSLLPTGYLIDVATDAAFSNMIYTNLSYPTNQFGGIPAAAGYFITNLNPGTTYYFRTRAFAPNCTTCYSPVTSFSTLSNPTLVLGSVNCNTAVFQITGATSTVSVSVKNIVSNAVVFSNSSHNGQTLTINNLMPSTDYSCTITTISSDPTCVFSTTVNFTTASALSAPIATSASNNSCYSFIANWNTVSGAAGYFVDVATNPSFAPNTIVTGYNNLYIAGGSTNSLPVVDLTQGQTYYYRISVQSECGFIAYSNTITVVTNATNCCNLPAAIYFTRIESTNNTCNSFEFGWSPVIGADGYYLDIALDANFTTFVPNYQNRQIVGNTYNPVTVSNFGTFNSMIVNTNLTPSTTYYMRIRAYSATCGISTNYQANLITTSGAPTVSANAIKCNSAIISWAIVAANITGWQVVITNPATSAVVYSNNNYPVGIGNILPLTGLTPSTTYSASITPITPSPACQINRTIHFTTASLLPAPTASAATNNNCGSIRANWNTVSGATGYYIDVATDPSFANNNFVSGYNNRYIANGNSNFLDIPGLLVGNTYYYRVRSANECVSSNSNVVSVTSEIGAPQGLMSKNVTCNSFEAIWSPVSCAGEYRLEISFDYDFTNIDYTFIVPQDPNPSYIVNSLTPSTGYYYRVIATDFQGNESVPSQEYVTTDVPTTTCGLRIIKDAPITYSYQDKNGMEENQVSQNINNGKSNGGKSNLTIGINFEVSPNPTASTISFTCESNEPMVYQLMDVQGKLLQNDKIVNGANISLDAYSKGIYILRVLSSDGTLLGNKRIIKQ